MKTPCVIVIGPDRVGKTTTVRNISRILGLPTFKAPSEKRIFKEGGASSHIFDHTLTSFLDQTGYRFVSDRGYPCEWVYSKVFGRPTDDQLLERIDAGHEYINTMILYLYSSVPPIEEDDLVPKDRYNDVRKMYERFLRWTSCRTFSYDCVDMLKAFEDGRDISDGVAQVILSKMGLK